MGRAGFSIARQENYGWHKLFYNCYMFASVATLQVNGNTIGITKRYFKIEVRGKRRLKIPEDCVMSHEVYS